MSVLNEARIGQLREQIRAAVVTVGDPGYGQARAVHNGMVEWSASTRRL